MEMNKYKYCTEPKWDEKATDEWVTHGGYHSAAEEICEGRDATFAEYPDKQFVWVLKEGHDTPRKFTVYAESIRQYSAREETGEELTR